MATIELVAEFRRVAGACEFDIDAPTVGQALHELVREAGHALEDVVFAHGRVHPGIAVLVNGRNIRFLQGLETPLGPGDRVAILPIVGGGTAWRGHT
jgi:MoaD family protein